MVVTDYNPLTDDAPAEVSLARSPLLLVLAQARFPVVASIEKREFIAPFQEAIRHDYPVLRPEQSRGLVIGPNGPPTETRENTTWRFHDATGDWRVSLSADFLSLETSKYTSRTDFLARLTRVLSALVEHINPAVIDRLGVRYIDRIVGDELRDLAQLVRPDVCGVMGASFIAQARHSIVESVFDLPAGKGLLMARWGLLPANGTVDPGAIEPVPHPSWLLDVDAFQQGMRPLSVSAVVDQARGFAERIYSMFRWVVTDEFLRRYGGNI